MVVILILVLAFMVLSRYMISTGQSNVLTRLGPLCLSSIGTICVIIVFAVKRGAT